MVGLQRYVPQSQRQDMLYRNTDIRHRGKSFCLLYCAVARQPVFACSEDRALRYLRHTCRVLRGRLFLLFQKSEFGRGDKSVLFACPVFTDFVM